MQTIKLEKIITTNFNIFVVKFTIIFYWTWTILISLKQIFDSCSILSLSNRMMFEIMKKKRNNDWWFGGHELCSIVYYILWYDISIIIEVYINYFIYSSGCGRWEVEYRRHSHKLGSHDRYDMVWYVCIIYHIYRYIWYMI